MHVPNSYLCRSEKCQAVFITYGLGKKINQGLPVFFEMLTASNSE